MRAMFAVVWHYWIGVALAVGAIASIGALAAGYLRKVESTRYPKGR
jgi:formate-dependent nitrite reductase membrane component NrfD